MKSILSGYFVFLILCLFSTIITAQVKTLDTFEGKDGWSFIQSDGVNLKLTNEKGYNGNAIRFDYDLTKGTGYGGFQKFFPIDLPENFEFTFYLKAESPANNLEVKFIDSTGNNVWWVINRSYNFPNDWTKIKIKKRHISFAWGPIADQSLKRIDRIEFTISSAVGGKGTVWVDDLKFEPLKPESVYYPIPSIKSTSPSGDDIANVVLDKSKDTYWISKGTKDESLVIDFKGRREFGGLQINWVKDHIATSFDILLSEDGKSWDKVYTVKSNRCEKSFIRLQEVESNYLKIQLLKSLNKSSFGICDIKFLDIKNSITDNDFFIYTARNSKIGDYPRYLLEQASYWTITGVNNDVKEGLINEDGMVEVEKAKFSIEPMFKFGDSLYNWSNVRSSQSLGNSKSLNDFVFLPSVTWEFGSMKFTTEATSSDEANINSKLNIHYSLENLSNQSKDFDFYLLIRPFQVNPYYQFLNLTGGIGKIYSLSEMSNKSIMADDKAIFSQVGFDLFSASTFDEGDAVDFIRSNKIVPNKSVYDKNGLANGIIKYKFHLSAGGKRDFFVVVPFYKNDSTTPDFNELSARVDKSIDYWMTMVDHVKFKLPSSADRIINAYRANLVYILINRDKVGIQPGSRSYERSWIRDGALTSSALLKSGIVKEVKDYIDWYSDNLFENGKVPCVVDARGPDPVPENDSHGEYIYLIREYFNFTKDTSFLKSMNKNVLRVVDYIETLIAQRSTDHFKNGSDSIRAYYGLVPESISHEGYSAKPMHSYWDNFFTMKGLKDATEIQKILGEEESYQRIKRTRDTFKENLYNSLHLAMNIRKIDYIPGCVELGDFDATSTTIALTPCNELNNMPKPQVYNTFDRYFEFFKNRRDNKIDWLNYTPYENRLIGSFVMLDQPERAHELIEIFLNDQRPQGWSHWAEVVWKDSRIPKYIGDMPHTWVGSDFINAIRAMFVYENEFDQSLVLGSALYQDWIDSPQGMSVENLPTYYGQLSYSIKKSSSNYEISITGDVKMPPNGIKIKNFNGSNLPRKVTVNGKETKEYTENEISVHVFPANVAITY